MSLGMRAIKVSISVSKCTQICWLSTNSEHFKIIDIEVENIEVVRFSSAAPQAGTDVTERESNSCLLGSKKHFSDLDKFFKEC